MARLGKRCTAAVAVVCAFGLVIAGCSKKDNGGGNTKEQNAKANAQAKALPGTDIISAPRSQLKQGGTLQLPLESYPQNFNPGNPDGNDVSNGLSMAPTLPMFFNLNEKGIPVPDKDYLESARIVKKSDPFTVEFKVNPKAVWSDGTPIAFPDFYGNWKAQNGKAKGYVITSSNGWEDITSITKGTNDHDIIVKFDQPYSAWQMLFNGLLPRTLTASAQAFNKSWKNKPNVSGGPFIISKVDSTAEIVTETPNPRWWGDKPKLDKIIFRALDLNATTGAFKNGEIDMVDAGKDVNTLKAAESVPHTKILRSSSVGWHVLNLNAKSPLLKNDKLRHAIALAIPRDQIAKLRETPFGAPPTVKNNLVLGVTQEGYTDDATAAMGPDQNKAKQILSDLGWKKQGKWLQKDGKTLTLRMVIPSQTSSQSDVSQVIQNALAPVGIQIKIQSVPANDFFTKYIIPGDFDINYNGWTAGAFPACENKSIFYPAGSEQNMGNASTPEVGKLFDQACGELDQSKRIDLEHQLDQQLVKLDSALPLFNDPAVAATNDKLANVYYYTSAFQSTNWEDVGWIK